MDNNIIISEDIRELVEETQNIIIEYFQDSLGDNFDEDKQNRLKQVFNSFSIISEDELTIHFYGGRCDCIDKQIEINRDIKVYPSEMTNGMTKKYKLMHELIHEYGHAFSNMNRMLIPHDSAPTIRNYEEGMQSLFSELVLNHYFKKNNIQANAISIGYGTKENSLPRTMLFLLSQNDEHHSAMAEYLLGNKRKFLSKFLPQEIVDKQNEYGDMISLDFSLKDIFNINPEAFKQIDENSVFCYKNNYIYALWLQNFVAEDIICDEFLNCSSKDDILKKYEQIYQKNVTFQVHKDDPTQTVAIITPVEDKQEEISTQTIGKRTIHSKALDKSIVTETFEEWKKRMIEMGILKE